MFCMKTWLGMTTRHKRNSVGKETQNSSKVKSHQINTQQMNHPNQIQGHNNQSPTSSHGQPLERYHQYQEMCDEPTSREGKELPRGRDITTSIVEDIKPELVQHGSNNNNNNNEDEADFPIAKRILRSSLIVSSVGNDTTQSSNSGGSLWLMNVDGQTNGDTRSDTNPQSTATSDSEVATGINLRIQ